MNHHFVIEENMTDFQYFLNHMSVFLPYVLLNIISSFGGIFGNILIIGSILCTKNLQNMTSFIIANIALADFFISSFTDVFAVAG